MECKKCGVKAHSNLCWKCKPKQPLKRSRIKQKVYSIAFRSKKRQKQETQYYRKERPVFLSKHPFCEFEGCGLPSSEVHHMKGRIEGLLCDQKYFLAVCHDHHTWIENNPEQAKEMGYSCSRLKKD
jgi:hypothetical protein